MLAEEEIEDGDERSLDHSEASKYRALAARAHFLPQNRPDCQHAVNEIARQMARQKLQAGLIVRNANATWALPLEEVEFDFPEPVLEGTPKRRAVSSSSVAAASVHHKRPLPCADDVGDSVAEKIPRAVLAPRPHAVPSGGQSPVSFRLLTFGVNKLAGTYPRSRVASQIREMTTTRGGPPVAVPVDLLSCPQNYAAKHPLLERPDTHVCEHSYCTQYSDSSSFVMVHTFTTTVHF